MKYLKKIKLLFILLFVSIFSMPSIFAAITSSSEPPATLTMAGSQSILEDRLNGPFFPRKLLSDGTEAYCASILSKTAPDNQTLYLGTKQGAGYTYILKNGYPGKSAAQLGLSSKNDAIYATQTALWWLEDRLAGISDNETTSTQSDKTTKTKFWPMVDKGISFKSTVNSKSTALAKVIYNLVNNAEKAQKDGYGTPSITVKYTGGDKTLQLTEDNKFWESQYITVTNANKDFDMTKFVVSVNTASDEIKDQIKIINSSGTAQKSFTNSGDKFKIRIPVSALPKESITKQNIVLDIKTNYSYYASYVYLPKDYKETGVSEYQNIIPAILYPVGLSQTKTANVQLTTEKLKIIKRDSKTKEPVSGALLTLKDSNGREIDTWTTDEDPYYIYNLDDGEYTIVEEKAPNGYKKGADYKFNLTNDGTTKTVYYDNNRDTNSIKISKQDITTKQELEGASLEIRDKDDKLIDEWVSTNTPHLIDSSKFEPLEEYRLIEKVAPDNYQLNTSEVTFKVETNGEVQSVVMYNELKPTKYYISKQDITTKEELPGAAMVIFDSNNEVIESWVSTDTPHEISNLEAGKYVLEEKIPPTNYKLNNQSMEFEVLNDGSVKTITMFDELLPTSLEIIKKDITTDKNIEGATLAIKDSEGNEVDVWTTDKNIHYVKDLSAGTYTLQELSAPEGYALNEENIIIDILNDGNVKQVILYNTPEIMVPITSLNFPMIIYILGILALIGGGILLYLNEKKKI